MGTVPPCPPRALVALESERGCRIPAAGRTDREVMRARLPEVVVIGAMKCATSAVHEYLDAHPDVSMSALKELNFFNGPAEPPHHDPDSWWRSGQWHRGLEWYAEQFDPHALVRGESSPAYTSPSSPEVADRMACVIPDAKLIYLVRDPVERAVSQYAHHRRDGTERREMAEALLDPHSQYLDRSRYYRRVAPFLERFPREHLRVVVQERLLTDRCAEVAALHRHVGLEPHWEPNRHDRRHHVGDPDEIADRELRKRFLRQIEPDLHMLSALLDDEISEWQRFS